MRNRRGRLVFATLTASSLAVALSIVALVLRSLPLGDVPVQSLTFSLQHFVVVAVMFVWPPLTVVTFIVGGLLSTSIRYSQVERQIPVAATFAVVGAVLGGLMLAGFWRLAFGVPFLEVGCWLVIGGIIGALSGFVFQRIVGAKRLAAE